MKVYGIAKEYWGGSSYSCAYEEDIELYVNKQKRDKQMEIYKSQKDTGEVIYSSFDVETED